MTLWLHAIVRTDGVGLSAPQVGLNVQLMVFNPAGEPGEGEEIVLVNPKINKYSDKLVPFDEGCLSFPGIYAEVVVCLTFSAALLFHQIFVSILCLTILPIIVLDIGFHVIGFAFSDHNLSRLMQETLLVQGFQSVYHVYLHESFSTNTIIWRFFLHLEFDIFAWLIRKDKT